ncbi:AI-2E family transporter [Paraoerskovia marina]|uniref:AI-2E family transporter n=1 Tax=Paraoerskovia marina TaxID=545619 RepID=UPI000492A1D7|nr:AI-2E family transporter [Paraoerskovia marina]
MGGVGRRRARRSERRPERPPEEERAVETKAPADPEPRGASKLWSTGFGHVATRSLQVLAVIAVAAVLIFIGARLTLVVIPVLIALVFAAAISPLVSWLRRRGVASILATWIALLALVAILVGVMWLVVLAVVNQWDELQSQALDGIDSLQSYVQDLPFQISSEQISSVRESATGLLQSSAVGSGAIAGVSQTANFVTGFFIMVVVLFFFLKDGPAIWEFLLRPFSGEAYDRGRRVGSATIQTLGNYVRGTAIIAVADAVGIGIGLAIVGVPLAIPLSVLVFLLAFIPLVGATLAGILAALVALVALGPVEALIVVAIVVGVNQLEGNFLQPVVMGRTLSLHPLVILIALTAGTVLVGITGAVLAVPIAASIWRAIQVWDGPDLPAKFARQKRAETV